MQFEQLQKRMDTGKQDSKHLCLLYLNACASGINDPQRTILARKVCLKLDLDDEAFLQAMIRANFLWQTRIDRIDLLAAESKSLEVFEKKTRKLKSRKGIPFSRARSLIVQLYSLTLQKYSLQTGKNHLRTRDLARLDSLLMDKKHLRPLLKIIFRPYYLAQSGQLKVTDQVFLDSVLVRVQLLADYLQAQKEQDEAKMSLILQFIRNLKEMSAPEEEAFLGHPRIQEGSFSASQKRYALAETGQRELTIWPEPSMAFSEIQNLE